jgi:hypothetical protein
MVPIVKLLDRPCETQTRMRQERARGDLRSGLGQRTRGCIVCTSTQNTEEGASVSDF